MRRSIFHVLAFIATVSAGAQQAPAGAGPGTQAQRPRQGSGADALVSVSSVETRTTSISVAGRLEPARRIAHAASISGFVERIHVRLGDTVSEGQALATIGRDAPGESYRPLVVSSRIAGRVSEIQLTQGAEVKAGAAVVTVVDESEFRLVAALSDKDAFRVAAMERPVVMARSADGTRLKGSLAGVSTEPDYATGLFSATIRFAAQPGARIGIVLFMDLPVESVRGQFVAQGLVVRRFGRSVMWVVDPAGALRQAQIVTGKPYGDDVLVVSGLEPGTRYPSRLTGFEKEGMSLQEYREAQKKGS
ncbi:MAG: HlyD family efflux transporter periplasmic adaptor subunit [Spirochaetes bacterium]|nr:HlyD family efflux transporter periplasmic adaptor subunit [Spirochaetota bacterium]MBU1080369.1 HlyD family efflux transporter periplasmic adaptor subunit [Spirochaetota bacterium]